jgi:hypothetical protein
VAVIGGAQATSSHGCVVVGGAQAGRCRGDGGRRTGAQAPEDGVGGGAGGCGEGNDDGALSAPYLDLSLLCFSVTTRSCPIFRA